MSFIEKNLSNNEVVLYKAKLHWIIYLRGIFWAALGLLIGSASYAACGLLFTVGVISFIMAIIVNQSSEFAVTNKRVILKTGLIKRKFCEIQLNKSEGLQIEEGMLGRILGFGKVRITSGGVVELFSPIANPFEFKKQINNAIEGSFNMNLVSA
ncbi:PH domain-containing protein [Mucilaginibacter lutimaris]|uniref:PH domain-containing protein n=1 Tax=Mucilaginibacter lutimaris TaxID=931629 RepID=A0ABW2ZF99_9SPHI